MVNCGSVAEWGQFFIGLIALYYGKRMWNRLTQGEKVSNIPELLNEIYIFGKMKCVSRSCKENGVYPKITSLDNFRDCRNIISEKIREDPEKYLKKYNKKTLCIGKWENHYAYNVSIALNRIGYYILNGAIPIDFVIPNVVSIIISDWRNCKELITQKLRIANKDTIKEIDSRIPKTYVVRMHAEWLAYASAYYMLSRYDLNDKNRILDLFPECNATSIKKREQQLRSHTNIKCLTSTEIDKFLYTDTRR